MGRIKDKEIQRQQPSQPVSLNDLIEQNLAVFCWCNRCGHNADIAPQTLTRRFGHAFAVPELGGYLRCSHCQSKDVTTRPSWPKFGGQIARHG